MTMVTKQDLSLNVSVEIATYGNNCSSQGYILQCLYVVNIHFNSKNWSLQNIKEGLMSIEIISLILVANFL